MAKPKLTPWFPATENPSRPGWYDVTYAGDSLPYSVRYWFDGLKWRAAPGEMRTSFGNQIGYKASDKWRGLAEQPKEQKK